MLNNDSIAKRVKKVINTRVKAAEKEYAEMKKNSRAFMETEQTLLTDSYNEEMTAAEDRKAVTDTENAEQLVQKIFNL